MISHIVLLRFPASVTADQKAALYRSVEALQPRIPGMTGVTAGADVSPEGLGKGFADGFIVTFEDAAARDRYLADEEHGKVGEALVALIGGIDNLLVFDLSHG